MLYHATLVGCLAITLVSSNAESCDSQSGECSSATSEEEIEVKVEGECSKQNHGNRPGENIEQEKWKEFNVDTDVMDWRPCTAVETIPNSVTSGGRRTYHMDSRLRYDINYYWVTLYGDEMHMGTLSALEIKEFTSYAGHLFRFRSMYDNRLISEQQLPVFGEDEEAVIYILPCGDPTIDIRLFAPGRDAEFESLVLDPSCEGDDSRTWSCVRHVTLEEELNRNRSEYGFIEGEEINGNIVNEIGKTTDDDYVKHLRQIPPLNDGPGWLLMNMTDLMKNTLLSWYAEEKAKGRMEPHGDAGGPYSNSFIVPIEKLNLDNYPEVHGIMMREMREILQWWANQQLKHSSTFGLRHYKRGSMLLNHVDRMDTHIASAVLQVAQENVDPNGGWPLEVILPLYCTKSALKGGDPGCHVGEVYLQPGQLVLYQSGCLMHGRPMRFRGEGFGNVFTHFAPIDWFGPEYSAYTGKTKKKHRKYNQNNIR